MSQTSLTPVLLGLRTGLHVLFASLLGLVLVQLATGAVPSVGVPLALTFALGGTYAFGVWSEGRLTRWQFRAVVLWLVVLSALWVGLLVFVPAAVYLVFPLFFLYLQALPLPAGPIAVVVATVVAIVALGLHTEFTLGGVLGPTVGASVALLVGLGVQALSKEASEREALLVELVATRDQLMAVEREQGVLEERERLAREIHDTVAQDLSSIHMLLYAAERADPTSPGIEHVRLARQTAADGLAETRLIIRDLSPTELRQGLAAALQRLVENHAAMVGYEAEVQVPGSLELPMDVQAALLRVAQSAIANVDRHAQASQVLVALRCDETSVSLVISDNGIGFDPSLVRSNPDSDSFGLVAMETRIGQLGGTLSVNACPGQGTTLEVDIDLGRK